MTCVIRFDSYRSDPLQRLRPCGGGGMMLGRVGDRLLFLFVPSYTEEPRPA